MDPHKLRPEDLPQVQLVGGFEMPLPEALKIVYIEMMAIVDRRAQLAKKQDIDIAMKVIAQHLNEWQLYKNQYGSIKR